MKSLVVDANIIIKWIFPENPLENNTHQALQILDAIKNNAFSIIQPPHWMAEVVAVVTRLEPNIVNNTIDLLDAMGIPIENSIDVYKTAAKLANRFNHHLFDTLYHSVALINDGVFITDDEKYFKKALKVGFIQRLANFSLFEHA